LVEKVTSRKENKDGNRFQFRKYVHRQRSRSVSEIELGSCGLKMKKLPEVNDDVTPVEVVKKPPHASESGSPTMEQALLMSCSEGPSFMKRINVSDYYYSSLSDDYNLDELVKSVKLKHGSLSPPATPSPPDSFYRKSPGALFGTDIIKLHPLNCSSSPDPSNSRLKLECGINRKGYIPHESCSTPEEYYMAGHPPYPFLAASASRVSWSMSPESNRTLHADESTTSEASYSEIASDIKKSLFSMDDSNSSCVWSGSLPPRNHKNPIFSSKIFIGGVPWDVTESSLVNAFGCFGPIRIEWPGKDTSPSPPKGYVYIIFEDERHVPLLLSQCTHDYTNGGSWYFKISSRRMRSKEVQIIPWVLADSNYLKCHNQLLDPQKTVFVGALHGMLNAEGLANIFDDLFGNVVYAGIDTDKHKYPIGSGRVTFSSGRSYMKAVAAAYVELKCQKFNKKVQVDPYLEDSLCSNCLLKQGPYFCRDLGCFNYLCRHCWELAHSSVKKRSHKPLMRNNRSGGGPATRPIISLTPVIGSRDQTP